MTKVEKILISNGTNGNVSISTGTNENTAMLNGNKGNKRYTIPNGTNGNNTLWRKWKQYLMALMEINNTTHNCLNENKQ